MTDSIQNEAVRGVFEAYPEEVRPAMLSLRQLILDTAASMDAVGPLEETLKWGEPSFLTSESKSGSTIRIDWKKRAPEQYAMYFICHTNLVNSFREVYSEELSFDGNRSIVFQLGEEIPEPAVSHCIAMALTYHLNK